jgi:hypothetical protein
MLCTASSSLPSSVPVEDRPSRLRSIVRQLPSYPSRTVIRAYDAAMTENSDAPPASAPDGSLDEFRSLVRAAFEQAMSSGKADWHEMTTAVLKNRILNLTNKQFSQSRYGSPSFIHLVRRVPDLLEVIDDRPPFRLKLRAPITEQPTIGPTAASVPRTVDEALFESLAEGDWRRVRIRDDLWRAIIDYGSNKTYVLDPETGLARQQEVGEDDSRQIPTASSEEVAEWRRQFVESLSDTTKEQFANEFRAWLEGRGRQSDLPRQVRGLWTEFLKKTVGTRLVEWFRVRGEFPPNDMFVESERRAFPPAESIDEVVRTRQLRDLIIRAVRTMTYDELAQLPLPAYVLLRVSGGKSQYDG